MTAIVLDTETTGLNPSQDRVIELAIVDYDTGDVLMNQRFYPGMSIPEEVIAIHGITDADVANCPLFAEHAAAARVFIETAEVVIGQNPFYDRDMLDAEFARLNVVVKWPVLVCTRRTWNINEPPNERSLDDNYRRFVTREKQTGWHGALIDTQRAREVMIAQRKLFGLESTPWVAMDPQRSQWFGPSDHLLLLDSGLTCNFGKHLGKHVASIDVGMWRWITSKSFPDHVTLVAIKMIEWMDARVQDLPTVVDTWARNWKKEHP